MINSKAKLIAIQPKPNFLFETRLNRKNDADFDVRILFLNHLQIWKTNRNFCKDFTRD